MKYDVCIIGGGAAGLAAAASFNNNVRVCLLEKNMSPGRKIAATGGGRCNLTNSACDNCGMVLEFFRNLGLETHMDEEGRYFPYSNRAADVAETLLNSLGENVAVRCGFSVTDIDVMEHGNEPDCPGFAVSGTAQGRGKGEKETVVAERVLIAMGGKAAPQFGTTGDGYGMAKSLGHSVTRVFPILSGLECRRNGVNFRKLKGIRASAEVTLLKDDDDIAGERGEVQFTEDGISGICVFNLTPYIRAEAGERPSDAMKRFSLSIDFAPDFREEELAGRNSSFGIVTSGLSEVIEPSDLKNWRLEITGVKGWRHAQSTSGGIAIDEIDMATMESTVVPGLYFAGEIIDVQGPCGGFNLQNAWETGIKAAAAINAAVRMRR